MFGCCLKGALYRDRLKYQDTQPVKKKGFLTSDFSKRDEFSMTFRTEQYRTLLQQVSVSCSLCFSAAFVYVCCCASRLRCEVGCLPGPSNQASHIFLACMSSLHGRHAEIADCIPVWWPHPAAAVRVKMPPNQWQLLLQPEQGCRPMMFSSEADHYRR